jgi:hypothetical protein
MGQLLAVVTIMILLNLRANFHQLEIARRCIHRENKNEDDVDNPAWTDQSASSKQKIVRSPVCVPGLARSSYYGGVTLLSTIGVVDVFQTLSQSCNLQ